MSRDKDSNPSGYRVGKGKPPVERQFKKGTSGNPNGRPLKKKVPSLKFSLDPYVEAVLSEGARMVTVREGEATTELSTFSASQRRLGIKAMSGDVRAIKLYSEMNQAAQEKRLQESFRAYTLVMEYKETWAPVFAAAKKKGRLPPAQLPHPDHVIFCYDTGLPKFTGPQDTKAKEMWERLKGILKASSEFLAEEEERSPEEGVQRAALKILQKAQRRFLKLVPEGWNWREEL